MLLDNQSVAGLDVTIVANSKFKTITIIYSPASTRLQGTNTVAVPKITDTGGNEQDQDETTMFSYP